MIRLYKGNNFDVIPKIKDVKPNIVYLDPPYNTKKTNLSYKDNFNNDDWFNEFSNLLKEIKNIIAKDSVIFVSIGYQELVNAKNALDIIFGKKNFQAIMPRLTQKTAKTTKLISRINDFVIVYTLGKVTFIEDDLSGDDYKFKDKHFDKRGKYFLRSLDYKDFSYRKNADFPIENNGINYYASGSKEKWESRKIQNLNKDWCWLWSKERVDFAIKNDYIDFKNNRVFKKTYQNCKIIKTDDGFDLEYGKRGKPFSTLELTDKKYANNSSKNKESLENFFTYPKSFELIKFLFKLPNFKYKCVLDPYAGSGISGIISNEMGIDCILIQKSEIIDENTDIYKRGINDLFDLTKEILKEKKIKVDIYGK